jgi:hypothetical protein
MLFARLKLCLVTAVAWAAIAGVNSAPAQEWTPFGPSDVRYDLELFKRPDISAYADWPRPNYGFFFQYERLYWSIDRPRTTDIGLNGARQLAYESGPVQFDPVGVPALGIPPQPVSDILRFFRNTEDTCFLGADQTWGNRFELGFVEPDDKGWLVSIMNLQTQNQSFVINAPANNGIVVLFRDPLNLRWGFVDSQGRGIDDDLNIKAFLEGTLSANNGVLGVFGRPRPIFNEALTGSVIPTLYAGFTDFGDQVPMVALFNLMTITNVTSMDGVEIDRTWRYPPNHRGNQWQLMLGVRWLVLNDFFGVTAFGAPISPGVNLLPGTSYWNTSVNNNMFGPQIGLRWDHTAARWDLSSELRFMSAVNFQSTHLNGELGSGLNPGDTPVNSPLLLDRTTFQSWRYDATFAPVGEIRATVSYKLTQAIAVQAGYNAIIGGGISRASRRIDYVLPALQILDANKNDSFFTNGVNIGITCNR